VLFFGRRNSYGIWSPETPAPFYCHFYFARRTSKEELQSAYSVDLIVNSADFGGLGGPHLWVGTAPDNEAKYKRTPNSRTQRAERDAFQHAYRWARSAGPMAP
jgi:hypothetical protein